MLVATDQYGMFFKGRWLVDEIRQYLIRIIVVALICGMLTGLLERESSAHRIARLICGLLMVFTVVSPIMDIDLQGVFTFTDTLCQSGEIAAQDGQDISETTMRTIIKGETEAYILDKAASLGVELEVDVLLEDMYPMAPKTVRLSGSVSPYVRNRLQNIIAEELGISKENQIWT